MLLCTACSYTRVCARTQEVIRILRESPRDSGTERHCLALLKGYQTKLDELRVKVLELGNGFELMTSNFFTDVNRLVINVPLQAPARRTPIMPHEQDATRKKRKTAAPRPPGEKKGRKKRLLKPQKVAPSTGSSNKKRAARAAASTSGTLKLEHP